MGAEEDSGIEVVTGTTTMGENGTFKCEASDGDGGVVISVFAKTEYRAESPVTVTMRSGACNDIAITIKRSRWEERRFCWCSSRRPTRPAFWCEPRCRLNAETRTSKCSGRRDACSVDEGGSECLGPP